MGSPPRVRGKVQEELIAQGADRITPACAGKRQRYNGSVVFSEDHPRVCGEKETRTWWGSEMSGSPPRVRGKVSRATVCESSRRITPACAGKSGGLLPLCGVRVDHPRVCGEKRELADRDIFVLGSPPRVRGKDWEQVAREAKERTTPACAGKSAAATAEASMERDHPRVCGEKSCASGSIHGPSGSPPRVRGKVFGDWSENALLGITPACAGKRPHKKR